MLSKTVKRSASVEMIQVIRRDRDGGEKTTLTKQSLLEGMYMWGVKSTVTKHSDFFD